MTTILWLGRDLRLADNHAVAAAVSRGQAVVPLYILDDEDSGNWAAGGASRWWLHGSLQALGDTLRRRGTQLILRRGKAEAIIDQIIQQTGATAIYWNRRYEPWATARNERLKTRLTERGIDAKSFNSALIREPWTLKTQNGDPYRVFTPFWKALRAHGVDDIAPPPPSRLPAPATFPDSDTLSSWALRPKKPDWAAGLRDSWTPGEKGAHERLRTFAEDAVLRYRDRRNIPGVEGTSRLSPHLLFGEIGPRQIWRMLTTHATAQFGDPMGGGVETFLSEIAWREFSYHLLFHFPTLPSEPMRREFSAFPWANDSALLGTWRRKRALDDGVDAQSRSHDRRFLLDQGFVGGLATRRDLVLGHAGRRRPCQQFGKLAVGCRMRRRRGPVLQGLQSVITGREVRSRRRLRSPLGSGADETSRRLAARAMGGPPCGPR